MSMYLRSLPFMADNSLPMFTVLVGRGSRFTVYRSRFAIKEMRFKMKRSMVYVKKVEEKKSRQFSEIRNRNPIFRDFFLYTDPILVFETKTDCPLISTTEF